jgi:hypothetical protein
MDNDIDTGLPALSTDQFWRVERLDYSGIYGATHKLLLMRKRDHSFATWWADLSRKGYLKEGKREKQLDSREIVRSKVYYEHDQGAVKDADGRTTNSKGWSTQLAAIKMVAETKLAEWAPYAKMEVYLGPQSVEYRVFDIEIRPDLIRIVADEILAKRAKDAENVAAKNAEKARLAVYEGDYPPKKLGA